MVRTNAAVRMRAALCAAIVAILALALSTTARATTITVDSLDDTGARGICVLRDAITAANTLTATNGCAAGTGKDTIQFSVTGTIDLASTLPTVLKTLTINGPASPGITIDGGGKVQVMQVGSSGELNLTNLTIAHGNSAGDGGGINNLGTLTVTDSTFSGNFGGGGAIYNLGTLNVTNSTFSANTASLGGGGINNLGTLNVTNSTFSGNFADGDGGAILNGGFLTFLNVVNSTFSGNFTYSSGGGISNDNYYAFNSFKSTILANSVSGGNCSGTISDAGYNISDDSTCGFAKTGSANNGDGVNPLLSSAGLANNGGPTKTIALLAGSPAIDAIPLADCTDQPVTPNPIITDQRLFPRPDDEENVCDIGAYEFQDIPPTCSLSLTGVLNLDPAAGDFDFNGGFTVVGGCTFDPATQRVMFSLGNYTLGFLGSNTALRIPAGSFVLHGNDYQFQEKIDGVFVCFDIYLTSTPGKFLLYVSRQGGTLNSTSNPVPVTLVIGGTSGSANFNATFY